MVSHPGVAEAAAIGIDDEKTTETAKIVVVRKDPHLSATTLVEFCREHLTGYKIPRHVEFVEDLPKTIIGKILRRAVKDNFGGRAPV